MAAGSVLIAPPAVAGVVINVPSQRSTIQAGIEAASDGDTVLVAPGTYVENINFKGKAIEVKSSGGPQVTTIDGGGRYSVVVFATGEGRGSVLSGFRITNGIVGEEHLWPGWSIVVAGAGIAIYESSPTVTGNIITANNAGEYHGGGIGTQGGRALIRDNYIAGNDGYAGGGIALYGGAHEVEANVIEDNIAEHVGGGIQTETGTPVVKGNYIHRNHAGAGGGMYMYGPGLVVNNVVLENSADAFGGGLGVSEAHILHNTIVSNTAPTGAGVEMSAGGVVLTNNIVLGRPGQQLISCSNLTPGVAAFSHNDAYSLGGLLYDGCGNPTGTAGNISADPRFPPEGGYTPMTGSPVIDAGTNLAANLPLEDHFGHARITDGNGDGQAVVDMGAVEAAAVPLLAGDGYHPLSPARILDTRIGLGAPVAKLGPGEAMTFQVTGRGGVPASGVTAVTLNVAVTEPTTASWLSAWPAGTAWPGAANLNFVAGQTVANSVVVKVGDGGRVSLLNSSGSTHVIADVVGWYGEGLAGARYIPRQPIRILDTRTGAGAPLAQVKAGGTIALQVTGRVGIPATGVSAVVMNVAVTGPQSDGWLTAWPTGDPRPHASSLNYAAGQTVPNLVVVKVGPDGMVNLFSSGGPTDIVADVAGWFGADGEPGGSGFSSLLPARILDTRVGIGAPTAPLAGNSLMTLQVTGRGGVPATGVAAVVLNVTVTAPATEGWLTLWPSSTGRPLASNLNFVAGQTVPNLVVVKVSPGGAVDIYSSGGPVDVVADVAGYYLA
ncbi:MAG TPA: right-handed parallel beta-helix repeat-containing protein [Acidimicrobiales bacterium]|nr:right-handed parallel beta-helix repeat-containing protein [Acidimicrobiales bacterium]